MNQFMALALVFVKIEKSNKTAIIIIAATTTMEMVVDETIVGRIISRQGTPVTTPMNLSRGE